uniref:F-box domain and ankyrin repeat protein n=1 Tax=Pithovirus LCPAC304 TaxID=2506594 RepID=A0A481Z9Q0_9VIRU|nr:MAG: F-box domain and ankyrin repeat protein [Pithovirus LCPAC304]
MKKNAVFFDGKMEHYSFTELMNTNRELLIRALVHLSTPALLRFRTVSKAAKAVCDDDFFWKLKSAHDFPDKDDGEDHRGMWRETYKTYWEELSEKFLSYAEDGHLKSVESLLRFGIDPNIQDQRGWTALSLASLGGHIDIVRLLLMDTRTLLQYCRRPVDI